MIMQSEQPLPQRQLKGMGKQLSNLSHNSKCRFDINNKKIAPSGLQFPFVLSKVLVKPIQDTTSISKYQSHSSCRILQIIFHQHIRRFQRHTSTKLQVEIRSYDMTCYAEASNMKPINKYEEI